MDIALTVTQTSKYNLGSRLWRRMPESGYRLRGAEALCRGDREGEGHLRVQVEGTAHTEALRRKEPGEPSRGSLVNKWFFQS